MRIGILKIDKNECVSDAQTVDISRISYELSKYGYFVTCVINSTDTQNIFQTFEFVRNSSDAVLICGQTNCFYDVMREKYDIRSLSTFLLDNTPCAVSAACDKQFLSNTMIPMLNSRCKTYYATSIFHTVGKTEAQLRTLLKDYIKNRNKISFKFISLPPECTVLIRYSNKTQKTTVNELLYNVTELLKDCTVAYDDIDLAQKVADSLLTRNRTLGLAESFTGGNIAARLVAVPGISAALKEGIVCYSNEAKRNRLHVSQHILNNYGAVSIETAYEMAANLLMDGKYDYVVATTGNAGPTAEKENECGVCYIAVGDKTTIDIFPYRFEGDRAAVIHSGTQTALYHLYKALQNSTPEKNNLSQASE